MEPAERLLEHLRHFGIGLIIESAQSSGGALALLGSRITNIFELQADLAGQALCRIGQISTNFAGACIGLAHSLFKDGCEGIEDAFHFIGLAMDIGQEGFERLVALEQETINLTLGLRKGVGAGGQIVVLLMQTLHQSIGL